MNKLICCIGDSLTAGDYGVLNMTGIANVQEKNYPYFLKQLTKCEVRNYGYCGAKASDILWVFNQGRIDVSNANIIIILLGTNGGNTPEGNSKSDLAYKEIIKRCQAQSPRAEIFLCTPPHATTDPKRSNFGFYENTKNAAIFVKNLAKTLHLHEIDLFNDDTFNSDNESIMQPNDGLHFSEVGYQELARIIYQNIKKFL